MLGFDITIWRQVDEPNKPFDQRKGFIPGWETGLGGVDWLDQLRNEGRARFVDRRGYPDHYFATAGVLTRALARGIPTHDGGVTVGEDYVLPAGWSGPLAGRLSAVAECPPDEELLVEVWDLS